MPLECTTIVQGELMETINGLYFRHTFVNDRMPKALRVQELHATGYGVKDYLRRVMDDIEFDSLITLVDSFPEHVIELTVCDKPFGDLSWRSIVWEVRRY